MKTIDEKYLHEQTEIISMAALMLYNTGDPKYLDNIKSAVANLENAVEEVEENPVFGEMLAFVEGFARVKSNDMWNFINTKGDFLSNRWFDYCFDFKEGFAAVCLNDKWNYINENCEYLSKVWFEDAFNFSKGHARVELNGKWYDIDAKGNLTEVIV